MFESEKNIYSIIGQKTFFSYLQHKLIAKSVVKRLGLEKLQKAVKITKNLKNTKKFNGNINKCMN